MGVAHLDVVAEDVVVADFEAGNAGAFALALLQVQEVVLARARDVAQLVEFGVHAAGDDAAAVGERGGVGRDFALDAVAYEGAGVELRGDVAEHLFVGRLAAVAYRLYGRQGHPQLHRLPRGDATHGHFGDEAFEVADERELAVDELLGFGVAEEKLHHLLPVAYGGHLFQREGNPPFQQAGAHGAHRAVDDVEQALAPFVHRREQFEAAHGKLVEAHIAVGFDAGEREYVGYVGVLGDVEVVQQRARGDDAQFEVLHAEAFEVLGAEVAQQPFGGRLLGEYPVVELEGEVTVAEVLLELLAVAALEEYLFGLEISQ